MDETQNIMNVGTTLFFIMVAGALINGLRFYFRKKPQMTKEQLDCAVEFLRSKEEIPRSKYSAFNEKGFIVKEKMELPCK